MKKITDASLFLLAFYEIVDVVYITITYTVPSFFIIYPALFFFFLIDAYFFKKLTSVIFWKIIFILGVIVLVIENTRLVPIFLDMKERAGGIYELQIETLMFIFINLITLLFIYRSYQFIISNNKEKKLPE